ncbi:MAG: biotin transporter BioY [Faecalibacillus sp.]
MSKRVRLMCILSMLLCILIILAQIKIDIGYVPITLQTLGIYMISLLLKPKYAFYVSFAYIFMGAIGLPVFSGFNGGIGSLLSYNGGYIFSFPIMAYVISFFGNDRHFGQKVLSCILGTVICYTIGTAWFMYIMKLDLMTSLTMCVIPFLLTDGLKILVSVILSQRIKLPL